MMMMICKPFFFFSAEIIKLLKSYGLHGEVSLTRKAGRERLSILKFTKQTGGNSLR